LPIYRNRLRRMAAKLNEKTINLKKKPIPSGGDCSVVVWNNTDPFFACRFSSPLRWPNNAFGQRVLSSRIESR